MTTISDVARLAGVSQATVSRVVSGDVPVAASTRGRVEAAIKELNYTPNGFARGLVTKTSSTVALILPDIANPFFPALARGVQDIASVKGLSVMISNSDSDAERERAQIQAFLSKQVDGIIIVSAGITAADVQDLVARGIQLVLAGRGVKQNHTPGNNRVPPGCDWVRIENYRGAFEATQHLLGLGHRDIAMINGPPQISTSQERLAGYRAALETSGIPFRPAFIEEGSYQFEGGYRAAEKLLKKANFTAIFAANDSMAIGALQGLKAQGLRLPDDVSIVGFDDVPLSSLVSPGLTTMGVSSYEMGTQAAQLLLERISGKRKRGKQVMIEPFLVLRESTAPTRHAEETLRRPLRASFGNEGKNNISPLKR
ncbi:MAG: LacI family DNA-binding transcriptional regulator [Chloroflexota bacterium]